MNSFMLQQMNSLMLQHQNENSLVQQMNSKARTLQLAFAASESTDAPVISKDALVLQLQNENRLKDALLASKDALLASKDKLNLRQS